MRILFYPANCVPFHGKSLYERPLGGTETGVIKLASALQELDYEVFVVSSYRNPPLTQPLYIPSTNLGLLPTIDAYIGVRDWQTMLISINAPKKFFWTGDAFDQPLSIGLGDKRIYNQFDKLLCVSEWQKNTLCKSSGLPIEKAFVIQNGADENNCDDIKNPYRLIYSSTPYRGLKYLIEIFPRIKAQVPLAELIICSGFDVYKGAQAIAQNEIDQFNQMASIFSNMPGVKVIGNVLQKDLQKQMKAASILAYPNTFAETSCITVIEAKRAGTVPITSRLGALPETVGAGGILISENPGSAEYLDKFIDECINLLKDQIRLQTLSRVALEESKLQSWQEVAKRFITLALE